MKIAIILLGIFIFYVIIGCFFIYHDDDILGQTYRYDFAARLALRWFWPIALVMIMREGIAKLKNAKNVEMARREQLTKEVNDFLEDCEANGTKMHFHNC